MTSGDGQSTKRCSSVHWYISDISLSSQPPRSTPALSLVHFHGHLTPQHELTKHCVTFHPALCVLKCVQPRAGPPRCTCEHVLGSRGTLGLHQQMAGHLISTAPVAGRLAGWLLPPLPSITAPLVQEAAARVGQAAGTHTGPAPLPPN